MKKMRACLPDLKLTHNAQQTPTCTVDVHVASSHCSILWPNQFFICDECCNVFSLLYTDDCPGEKATS